MSLPQLVEAIKTTKPELLSTDLFDTVLLRDHTIESDRLAIACRRGAARVGVDPTALTRLRWSAHVLAYRSVAMERPHGEASLVAIWRTVAAGLGLGEDAAAVLQRTEVDVDIEHLRPQRPLLELFERASRSGVRVIGVSDTYYTEADLHHILHTTVGPHPMQRIYASSELGLTKHAGGIFGEVARYEEVPAARILHVGDDVRADIRMAEAAGWQAVHLPRDRRHQASKIFGKALSIPIKMRRAR